MFLTETKISLRFLNKVTIFFWFLFKWKPYKWTWSLHGYHRIAIKGVQAQNISVNTFVYNVFGKILKLWLRKKYLCSNYFALRYFMNMKTMIFSSAWVVLLETVGFIGTFLMSFILEWRTSILILRAAWYYFETLKQFC